MRIVKDKEFSFKAASDKLRQLRLQFVIDNVFVDVIWINVLEIDEENWHIARHAHSAYEFHYIHSGSCFVQLDHTSFTAKEGEFYVAAPGVHHYQERRGPRRFIEFSILCTMRRMDERRTEAAYMLKVFDETPCRLFIDHLGCMDSYQQCLREGFYQQSGFFNSLLSYLKLTLMHTARTMTVDSPVDFDYTVPLVPTTENRRFQSIQDFITDNLYGPTSPADVARHMNLSTKQVCRIVMKECGMTTGYLIRHCKILEAKRLLLETRAHIREIADKLSFSDEHYFQRVFRSVTDVTPGAFREEHGVRIR